jgi:hypothetical protein
VLDIVASPVWEIILKAEFGRKSLLDLRCMRAFVEILRVPSDT